MTSSVLTPESATLETNVRSPGRGPPREDLQNPSPSRCRRGSRSAGSSSTRTGSPTTSFFEELNPAYEEHTGIRRDDALGRRLTEVIPNFRDDPANWMDRLGAVALTGQALQFEGYVAPLARWYQGNAYRPQPGYLAIVFTDISAAKRAAEELREREERYRTFFQNVAEGACVFDLVRDEAGEVTDGVLIDGNPAALRVLGASLDELRGKRASELFGREAVAPYLHFWGRIIASGRGITFNTHFGWNGRDYLASVFPSGPDQVVTGAFDVSERTRAERALANSEREAHRRAAELEAVLEAAPAAVIIARGAVGESTEGNRLGRELLPAAGEPMSRAAGGEEVRDYELEVAAGGGEVRHFLGNATPLRDERGQASGAVGAFVDITQRKRSAERLEALHKVGEELLRASSVSDVVETVFHRGLAPLGASTAVLATAEVSGELRMVHRAGGAAEIPCEAEGAAHCPIAEAAGSGKALWLESPDAIRARCPDCAQGLRQAYAAIPLFVEGRSIGALGIAFADPQRFDESDRHYLGTLVSRCALAVERARVFEEMERQRRLLDAVFAADPAGIALIGGSPPRVLMANPTYRSIAPGAGGDPVGKTIEEVWPPEIVRLDSRALVEKLLARREEYAGPISYPTPSGQVRHLSFRVCPLVWGGEPAMVTVFWDDTELEAARAEAARHAAELEAVFSAMGEGLVTYGPGGELRSANRRAMEMFGFARDLRDSPPPSGCRGSGSLSPTASRCPRTKRPRCGRSGARRCAASSSPSNRPPRSCGSR